MQIQTKTNTHHYQKHQTGHQTQFTHFRFLFVFHLRFFAMNFAPIWLVDIELHRARPGNEELSLRDQLLPSSFLLGHVAFRTSGSVGCFGSASRRVESPTISGFIDMQPGTGRNRNWKTQLGIYNQKHAASLWNTLWPFAFRVGAGVKLSAKLIHLIYEYYRIMQK